MWEAPTEPGPCSPEQRGNFTIHQMVESLISGAACKGNSGIHPDFLLPPSVEGTGQSISKMQLLRGFNSLSIR